MIKKINILIAASVIVLFANSANSTTKDCSAFKHSIDIKICEAQNKQAENSSASSTNLGSGALDKTTGFLGKISKKLRLKKHKKLREQGD
jgi:hypothetical protein|tara:strand:- start:2 stop:271 length:270 start_codon:yes stop_codon:yes gene_type:complete